MEEQSRVHEIQSDMVSSMKMSSLPPQSTCKYIIADPSSILVSGLMNFANAL
jgi:hypothetical protein